MGTKIHFVDFPFGIFVEDSFTGLSSYILATYENHEHQTIVICCKISERVISHMFDVCILGFLPVDTVMIKLWL